MPKELLWELVWDMGLVESNSQEQWAISAVMALNISENKSCYFCSIYSLSHLTAASVDWMSGRLEPGMEVTLTGQKTLEYRRLESSRSGQTGVFLNFFLQDFNLRPLSIVFIPVWGDGRVALTN